MYNLMDKIILGIAVVFISLLAIMFIYLQFGGLLDG